MFLNNVVFNSEVSYMQILIFFCHFLSFYFLARFFLQQYPTPFKKYLIANIVLSFQPMSCTMFWFFQTICINSKNAQRYVMDAVHPLLDVLIS